MPLFCRPSNWSFRSSGRDLFLGIILVIFQPRSVRAEKGLSYYFQSWQEEHNRIRVDSHYALAEEDVTTNTSLKAMGVIDSIVGATPTGETARTPNGPCPVAQMKDVRRACSVDLLHQFKSVNIDVGYAVSRENDYFSTGWSLNTVTNLNHKNTELLAGYGRTDDTIKESKLGWSIDRYKTGDNFILGIRQLINADTATSLSFAYDEARGFLSDPYKIVSTTKLDLDPGFYYTPPENRPRENNKVTLALTLNRNLKKLNAAVDISGRYYRDTFGVRSHTISVTWIQEWGEKFMVQPSIRLYRQTAADFYHHDLDAAGIITSFDPVLGETGTGKAPFYSSDHRLSEMETIDVGVKVIWRISPWLLINMAYNRYTSKGLDHLTPQDAYSKAAVVTLGFKLFR